MPHLNLRMTICVCSQEHRVYVEALQALCEGRVSWGKDDMPVVS